MDTPLAPASKKSILKRLVQVGGVFGAVILALLLVSSAASAGHAPVVPIADGGRIDDVDSVNEQTDLSGVIVGPHGQFGFAWDETDLSGNNSFDTCTYYLEPDDTVTAVCYSVQYEDGAVADGFPVWTVYDCGTGYSNGKCSGSNTTSTEYKSDCTSPEIVDPYFAADPDNDLQATCQLIGLDGNSVDDLLLVNTCSKPSASPSSVSKDCVFTDPPVFLTLEKVVDGGTSVPEDWTLTASGPVDASGAGSVETVPVVAGTYDLSEVGTTAAAADYELESLICSTDGGDPVDVTDSQQISVAGNFTVTTCTFTNVLQLGEIIVEKVTVPADDTTTEFSFTAGYLDDSVVITNGGSFRSGDLVAGPYGVTEVETPGWVQTDAVCTSDIDVDDASTLGSIDLDPGETITCVVTNTQLAGADVTKTGVRVGQEVWNWTLDKSIDLDGTDIDTDIEADEVAFELVQDESVTGKYTVTVSGSSIENGAVDWTIEVANPRDTDMVVDITDDAVDISSCSAAGELISLGPDGFYTILAGQTLVCSAQSTLNVVANTVVVDVIDSGVVTSTHTVPATATGALTTVDFCVDLSDTLFFDVPELNREICGDDVEAGAVSAQASTTFNEDACGPHAVSNTAALTDGGDVQITSDTVDVDYTVTCEVMDVTKSGQIVGDEVWTWTVDKNINLENAAEDDVANLGIAQGTSATGLYEIVLSGEAELEGAGVDWTVTITNPRSTDEVISINDPLLGTLTCTSGGTPVPADGSGNYPIDADETLVCAGSSVYVETSNSVTVTVVGESEGGSVSADATGDLNVVDGCVRFTDSLYSGLNDASICSDELVDGSYSVPTTPVGFTAPECGDYSIINTASIVGDDGGDFGSDTVTVNYEIVCGAISVEKSGSLRGTTTWTWGIDKNIDLDEDDDDKVDLAIEQGDRVFGDYEIVVTGTSVDTGDVNWEIEIGNPRFTPIVVDIDDPQLPELDCSVEPAEGGTYIVPAGSTLVCSGTSDLDDDRSNTVMVDVSGEGTIEKSADASVSFTHEGRCVNLTDTVYDDLNRQICGDEDLTNGQLVLAVDDVEFGTDVCGPGEVENIAALAFEDEPFISDTVTVGYNVECDDVTVSKSGELSGTTTWTWDVDKSVNLDGAPVDGNPEEDLVDFPMSQGSSMPVIYTVDLSAASAVVDSQVDWTVPVNNPRLTPVWVRVTDDAVDLGCAIGADPATPDGNGLYEIPAGETLTCTGTTSANVTTNDAVIEVVEAGVVADTINVSADAEGDLVESDRCVTIADSLYPELDQVICVADLPDGSISLGVSDAIVAEGECGAAMITENTASVTGNDSGDVVSDTVTISNTIECEFNGCTYTRGYWRTHSDSADARSAAKIDPTWELVGGADSEFLDSGMTYYEVLSAPARGDKWLILAAQYIAAELNVLSGADSTVVSETMAEALDLLSANLPGELSRFEARQARNLAETLDSYNNGYIGPGHCG